MTYVMKNRRVQQVALQRIVWPMNSVYRFGIICASSNRIKKAPSLPT
jgi:hypothetical protein